MCEIKKSMNDEVMRMKINEGLCAISGCNNKAVQVVLRGNCGVPVCKEHHKSV
ncbi:MAG: hypothetical protein R6U96_18690 [Promethearchaeia archaeon]